MAEQIYTPVHQETGIPLPVIVQPEDFTVSKSRQHHLIHPASREEVQDYAGKLLRRSRTQELPDQLHLSKYNEGYHRIFYGPEAVPADKADKVRLALLMLAGVIPREGIKLGEDGYEVRELSPSEHQFLSHRSVTHLEGKSPRQRQFVQAKIGYGLIRFALEQQFEELVSPRTRNRYLRTVDAQREKELGNQIIRLAVNDTVHLALGQYRDAEKAGMVDPLRRLGLKALVRDFAVPQDFGSFYEVVRQRFMAVGENAANPVTLQTGAEQVQLAA